MAQCAHKIAHTSHGSILHISPNTKTTFNFVAKLGNFNLKVKLCNLISNYQDLALCAVKVLLEKYQHDNEWKVDETKEWIWNVTYYQNSITSILNLKSISSATDTKYVA